MLVLRYVVVCQELGLRNYYHRKKLQLALESVAAGTQSPAASLDHNWVTSECCGLLVDSYLL